MSKLEPGAAVVEPPREGPLTDAEIERIAYDAGIRKSDAMDSHEAAGPSDTLRLVRHIRWLRDQRATALSDPAIERIRENFDKWAREKFIEPKSDLIQSQIPSLFDTITSLRSALSAAQRERDEARANADQWMEQYGALVALRAVSPSPEPE